ncbi:MAG: DUF1330 domain-containing protein [Solirubrobacteraceae bacterium]|jgi:uncharacterized protein (DUF1330 family)|nr:DUF1330 domain-containing protein [Solirubrobacteraceae bacterium]
MPVDPGPEDVKRYVEEDDGGPVVMLNMLKYKADGGRESYGEYGAKVMAFLEAVGGEILYASETSTALVAPDGWDWDSVMLIRYPSRAKFLEMVMDPDYQAITHLRTEGLDEAILQATKPLM